MSRGESSPLVLSWAKFPKRKKLPQASGLEVPPRPFFPGRCLRPRGFTLALGSRRGTRMFFKMCLPHPLGSSATPRAGPGRRGGDWLGSPPLSRVIWGRGEGQRLVLKCGSEGSGREGWGGPAPRFLRPFSLCCWSHRRARGPARDLSVDGGLRWWASQSWRLAPLPRVRYRTGRGKPRHVAQVGQKRVALNVSGSLALPS